MTDAFVQLPPDSSGKQLRMVDPGTGALQEVVVLADENGNLIAVTADSRPRILVRAPHQQEILEDIAESLREIKAVLAAGLGTSASNLLT
jgi:hypothetical protein